MPWGELDRLACLTIGAASAVGVILGALAAPRLANGTFPHVPKAPPIMALAGIAALLIMGPPLVAAAILVLSLIFISTIFFRGGMIRLRQEGSKGDGP
jgi:hypothetical protein